MSGGCRCAALPGFGGLVAPFPDRWDHLDAHISFLAFQFHFHLGAVLHLVVDGQDDLAEFLPYVFCIVSEISVLRDFFHPWSDARDVFSSPFLVPFVWCCGTLCSVSLPSGFHHGFQIHGALAGTPIRPFPSHRDPVHFRGDACVVFHVAHARVVCVLRHLPPPPQHTTTWHVGCVVKFECTRLPSSPPPIDTYRRSHRYECYVPSIPTEGPIDTNGGDPIDTNGGDPIDANAEFDRDECGMQSRRIREWDGGLHIARGERARRNKCCCSCRRWKRNEARGTREEGRRASERCDGRSESMETTRVVRETRIRRQNEACKRYENEEVNAHVRRCERTRLTFGTTNDRKGHDAAQSKTVPGGTDGKASGRQAQMGDGISRCANVNGAF